MLGVELQHQRTWRRPACDFASPSESTNVLFLPADAGEEAVK